MKNTIKKFILRENVVIKHIQTLTGIEVKVTLKDYDTYFDGPTTETMLANQRKQQLFNALKPV